MGNERGRGCESIVIKYPKIHDCRLSIPFDALDRSKLHSSDPEGIINALKHPKEIKNWIFTASYCGKTGPGEKLLFRDDAFSVPDRTGNQMYERLKKWDDYAELLIVRKSQFADYRSLYGSTYVIVSIPDKLDGVVGNVKDGGIGYARLFGQRLAYNLGLKAVWMLDYNILQCWKIPLNWNNEIPDASEPASFAEVMIHIESLFQDCSWERSLYPNMKEQAEEALKRSDKSTLQEIVGGFDRYGVVGICRGQQWRQNISHPIKRSYSVYSFFLLNVAKTYENGLFFPCRPIWEDIEFNNLLDENELMVCKMQVFSHEKPLRRQSEAQLPLISPSDSIAQWLHQHFNISISNCKDIMTIKSKNEDLARAHDKLLTTLQSSKTIGGDDGVFFVHNPTVEQTGALAGEDEPFQSEEHFIKTLLRNLPSSECFLNGGKYVFVIDRGKPLIKRLSEDPLHWTFAVRELEVEELNSIPENIARKYFIIQISKKIPLTDDAPSPEKNSSQVPSQPVRSDSSSSNKRKAEDIVDAPKSIPQRRNSISKRKYATLSKTLYSKENELDSDSDNEGEKSSEMIVDNCSGGAGAALSIEAPNTEGRGNSDSASTLDQNSTPHKKNCFESRDARLQHSHSTNFVFKHIIELKLLQEKDPFNLVWPILQTYGSWRIESTSEGMNLYTHLPESIPVGVILKHGYSNQDYFLTEEEVLDFVYKKLKKFRAKLLKEEATAMKAQSSDKESKRTKSLSNEVVLIDLCVDAETEPTLVEKYKNNGFVVSSESGDDDDKVGDEIGVKLLENSPRKASSSKQTTLKYFVGTKNQPSRTDFAGASASEEKGQCPLCQLNVYGTDETIWVDGIHCHRECVGSDFDDQASGTAAPNSKSQPFAVFSSPPLSGASPASGAATSSSSYQPSRAKVVGASGTEVKGQCPLCQQNVNDTDEAILLESIHYHRKCVGSDFDDPRNLKARKGRPRKAKHHSAAYDGKRWICCHQKNLTAEGCQNNDANGKPRHHPMGTYAEQTWPCCGQQHSKAGKNEGCQPGPHPNHHP